MSRIFKRQTKLDKTTERCQLIPKETCTNIDVSVISDKFFNLKFAKMHLDNESTICINSLVG